MKNRIICNLAFVLVVLTAICVSSSRVFDLEDADERQLNDELMDRREANEFIKRLFHPFSSKNEEIKRETYEVYEEKCKNIIPTKRFCPKLRTWDKFKNYENGE